LLARRSLGVSTQPAASQPLPAPPPDAVIAMIFCDGDVPPAKVVDCSQDPYCAWLFKRNPPTDDTLLMGPDQSLQNVFVSVVRGLPKNKTWAASAEPVVITEKCWFIPHVVGVMAGQPLEFRNATKTLEVPHGFAKENKEFQFNIPQGQRRQVILKYPEAVTVKCDVHPWELAYCHVVTHPFFAVSDARGRVVLRGLPPGEYELAFWHEKLGTQTRVAKVHPDRATELESITFAPPDRHRRPDPSRPATSRPG